VVKLTATDEGHHPILKDHRLSSLFDVTAPSLRSAEHTVKGKISFKAYERGSACTFNLTTIFIEE
jgi:hypothetical protein